MRERSEAGRQAGQTDIQERDGWRPLAVIQTQFDGEVS